MRNRLILRIFIGLAAFAVASMPSAARTSGANGAGQAWRDAFQSSPATYEAPSEAFLRFADEHWNVKGEELRRNLLPQPVTGTVRYRVTIQADGAQIRVRLSNEEGSKPLQIAAASVGIAAAGFDARPGSLRRLTFSGASQTAMAVGAPLVSDPVDLKVKAGAELVVSVDLAGPMMNEGRGGAGFVVAKGGQAMEPVLGGATVLTGRPLVTGVSVLGETAVNVVVAFGDSITDGNRATPGALHGWPEILARRLNARKGARRYSVINAGIAGNRVLAPGWGAAALARFDRDVLRIEGLSHVIMLEGINDINFSGKGPFGDNPEITSADLIGGYRQIIARAHARGVKVYLATLTPSPGDAATSTLQKRALREEVNRWIRSSAEPDAVIDFDAMVRDPAAPDRFAAPHDSGDHLHPSDAGHQAMGEGMDLALFP
ncbi:SGNH/GDSL hydrolase family protein [Novosphingobium subterraneum]|uniref:Putative esterase n=1 Tax=Novosphingobium subterraneum TaxID=48936 RepID=A0A0B9A3A1_9SPHN|nr:SGNH/GDSL hydrolase family protein [Novosphingobium subterraneum]KHS45049.1 putative esterase [Novosphingobium subterraneum]